MEYMNLEPFLPGLGQYLASKDLITYTLSGAGVVTGTQVKPAWVEGLTSGVQNVVRATIYNDDRSRDPWNPDVYVQLWFRSDAKSYKVVNRMADKVFDVLHNADPFDLPVGPSVLMAIRTTRAPTVPDESNRFERSDSYRFTLNPKEEA